MKRDVFLSGFGEIELDEALGSVARASFEDWLRSGCPAKHPHEELTAAIDDLHGNRWSKGGRLDSLRWEDGHVVAEPAA